MLNLNHPCGTIIGKSKLQRTLRIMLSNPKLVSGMQKEGFNYWVDGEGKVLGLHNDYWSLKKRNKEGFHQRIITLVSSKLGKDFGANIHATFHLLGANEICSLFIEPANWSVYINEGHDMEFYLRTGNVTNSLSTSETVEYLRNRGKI